MEDRSEGETSNSVDKTTRVSQSENELTILCDKKLWEEDESFEKVPEKIFVIEDIRTKSKEDIARDILLDRRNIATLHDSLRVDDLTNLHNARGLRERVRADATEWVRDGKPFIAFSIDLNNVQTVNNTFSHESGGVPYIQLFGEVLSETVRPNDIAARMHGDEFVIVVQCDKPEEGDIIRNRLYQAMQDKVSHLPSDHPLSRIKETVQLESAIGMSYQTWTEEELIILKTRNKEKIAKMIGLKMEKAVDAADVDMYEQKDIQKGKQQEGKKGNETRKSENKIHQQRHLWLIEDTKEPVPTKEEVFSDLVHKSQEQIADSIIENKKRIRSLQEQQTIDEMTGLLTRNGLRRRIKEVFPGLAREGKPFALLVGDVNELKILNDNKEFGGHAVGDAAISLIGQAIRESLRENDLGAHPYGDENIVFLPDVSPETAQHIRDRIYEKIHTLLSELSVDHPLYDANQKLQLGASFGVSHKTLTQDEINAFKNVRSQKEQGALVREIVLEEIVNADIAMRVEKKRIKEARK